MGLLYVNRGATLRQANPGQRSILRWLVLVTVMAVGSWGGFSVVTADDPPPPPGAPGPPPHQAPTITQLSHLTQYNVQVFQGRVSILGESAGGLTITFGGVLAGYSTTTEPDGYFFLTCQLPPDTYGDATAVASCPHGSQSNTASVYVAT